MAKKSTKGKVNSNKKYINVVDYVYNERILGNIASLNETLKKINGVELENKADYIIDTLGTRVEEILGREKYITTLILRYIEDICMIYKESNESCKAIKMIETRIRTLIKASNSGIELLIYTDKLIVENGHDINSDITAATKEDIQMQVIYLMLDTANKIIAKIIFKKVKLKNKRIKKIVNNGNSLDIIYSKNNVFSDLYLDKIYENIRIVKKADLKQYINIAYTLLNRYSNLEPYLEYPGHKLIMDTIKENSNNKASSDKIVTIEALNPPLIPNIRGLDIDIISHKDATNSVEYCVETKNNISKEFKESRKYIYPRSGVEVCFTDKNREIDSVCIWETKNYFFARVRVNNKIGFRCKYIEELINDGRGECDLELGFLEFNLKIKKENLTLGTVYKNSFIFPDSYKIEENLMNEFSLSIILSAYIAIYIAHCNPRGYNGVDIRSITRGESKNRPIGFRVAHIRRLPEGFNISEEAMSKAKEYGFDYIPEGKTFVSMCNENFLNDEMSKLII